mmetsp:Transcript_39520/g.95573  ORF Transcript_39520/g.95573 Transcript_39520/m.95573 type:complete len:335 (+) Transcript_39520:92-1096(+)|eukprot:CAMPEP_0113645298 /NCGR_PEP_ID=MMETSP0017_2-20120614/23869_1 /TAXON_ID=2856 /ORGANISM="Cylindrotheca closterium" /LENGTH=334 /DNA_ID=CAMNT_0000557011 /DNA_START=74 /DNA_END=1078 /DNA_ORIENTATION=+ /assembly_acc=CAM_ASM_000147
MTSAGEDPAADITAAFGTFDLDEDDNDNKPTIDSYDPFGVGAPTPKKVSPEKKKSPSKKASPEKKDPPKKYLAKDVKANSVPPLIAINFKIHEEISSIATMDPELEGSSEIMVQGGVMAQMTSSDAHKNHPWILDGKTRGGEMVDITPNVSYSKKYDARGQQKKVSVITIPKTTVGFVPIASYHFKETIDHMPLLLERRVTRKGDMVQVAVQVRSKLTNLYDLTDLSITMALPDPVIEDDVEVNVGEGTYEQMKRVITWKLSALQKGDSFMVSVRCLVNEDADDASLKFPIILRCSSLDQISTGEFIAVEAMGYPAALTTEVISRTFRLIHRLK